MSPIAERFTARQLRIAAAAFALVVLIVVAVAVTRSSSDDSPNDATSSGAPSGVQTGVPSKPSGMTDQKRCLVMLHGKGGTGAATRVDGGITVLSPRGNSDGWGGRQWTYADAKSFAAAQAVVEKAIDDAACTRVVLDGFSNGAAFAAKLYCNGVTFNSRVVGVLIDDPVTDHAVEGCAPTTGVKVALYWTGALEGKAIAGWKCAEDDWTCEGGTTIGIAAYAQALGTTALTSPQRTHAANTAAIEPLNWLAG